MYYYIIISFTLFFVGALGMFLSRKHVIIILISLELLLLSANFNFIVFSVFLDDLLGQIYSLMVLVLAASESAIALAIIIVYYRLRGGISVNLLNLLKG